MANHDNDDYLKEHRKLFCNSPLIGKGAECKCNKHRKDGNYHLGNNGQHNLLELLQHLSNHRGPGPCGCQAQKKREHQGAHHRHNLRYI